MDTNNKNTNNEDTLRVRIIEESQNIAITTGDTNIKVFERSKQISVTRESAEPRLAEIETAAELETPVVTQEAAEPETASAIDEESSDEAEIRAAIDGEEIAAAAEEEIPAVIDKEETPETPAATDKEENPVNAVAGKEEPKDSAENAAVIGEEETVHVIGVRFRTAGKVYYFDPGEFSVRHGSHVIVETARGVEYGTVVGIPMDVKASKITQPLKEVIRVATREDTETEQRNRIKEKDAYRICQEKIRAHGLDMKLINA